MSLIPSGAAAAAGLAMIPPFPRFLCLMLLCLAGLTGNGRAAMGETSFTRSSSAVRTREDALAWSLLGTAFLTFGMVTACGWGIRRHQKRSGPEAEFLDELRRENENQAQPPSSAPSRPLKSEKGQNRPAWEKPADWWRQDFPRD
ncbi:MAG: hypothetical protein V4726_20240 [Verrucomicrobiota bacterium]